MNGKNWLITGGVIGLLAVVFGAFGAHGIEGVIPQWYGEDDLKKDDTVEESDAPPTWYRLDQLHQKKLKTWITGVRYHFYHTLAIIAVGVLLLVSGQKNKWLDCAATCFVIGIAGFSGSIYVLVISKVGILGMTAALGGVILVLGWLFFVLGMLQFSARQPNVTLQSEASREN